MYTDYSLPNYSESQIVKVVADQKVFFRVCNAKKAWDRWSLCQSPFREQPMPILVFHGLVIYSALLTEDAGKCWCCVPHGLLLYATPYAFFVP